MPESNRFADVLLIARDLIKDVEAKGLLRFPMPLIRGHCS